MSLQSAGYRLNFGRGDGPPFCFAFFQLQSQFFNRRCSFVQTFTVVDMLCLGHSFCDSFLRTKTDYCWCSRTSP